MGARPALAKMRRRVTGAARPSRFPSALNTLVAAVRHTAIRAARAVSRAVSTSVTALRRTVIRAAQTTAFGVAVITSTAAVRRTVIRATRAVRVPSAVSTLSTAVRHTMIRATRTSSRAVSTSAITLQQAMIRATRTPAFGVAVITCLIFAGVVGAAAPPFPAPRSTLRDANITPVAAVARASTDPSGPLVIAVQHPPTGFHVAAATVSAPPPTLVVNAPGALGIPKVALSAYRNAERMMAGADPGCGISWNLLAGIGRIESMHANGGATDARGTAIRPIYGPALDGTLPGNEVIVQNSAGGRVTYARAMGPMQFLPGTWARYASDGDGDGVADPQNLYDSTLAAARYLCTGGLNLRLPSQVMAAILRYNNSMPYAQNVLGWAAAYATGVVPVDLPALTGPPPPIADLHLENPEGLGPGLPLNIHGLPSTDPLAQMPLIDLNWPGTGSQQPMWPWQQPAPRSPSCTVICIGQAPAPPQQLWPNPLPPNAVAPLAPATPPGLLPGPPPATPPGLLPGPPPATPPGGAPPNVPPAGPTPELSGGQLASPGPISPAGGPPVPNAPPATGPAPGPAN
jgi:membrane-bound lytic murein transglycosylase B